VHSGAVDIYLLPSSSTLSGSKPLLADVTPQSIEEYENVMAGSYTIVVTPTGVITTLWTLS
jgi:hypothetical protein